MQKKRFIHSADLKRFRKNDRTLIHTHPFEKDWSHPTALPSLRDLNFMVRQLRKGPVRMFFIASRNSKGAVLGWTAFRPTKKLVEKVKQQPRLLKDWPIFSLVKHLFPRKEDISLALVADTFGGGVTKDILQFLLDEKLVQLRFLPVKQKVYEPHYQRFVTKKQAKKMEITFRKPFPE